MKKLIALVLTVVLLLSVCAVGTAEAKPFKYGFACWGTADEHGRTLNKAGRWAVEAAGGEWVMDATALSAESTVAAIENLIAAGCQMVSFCTYAGEASVPTISDICREKGVYWTMWDTEIADPEIAEYIAEDPYYLGCTSEDNLTSGYNTMKAMADAGCKNVLICRYGMNIPTCDDRCNGAKKYIDEVGGINIVDDIIVNADAESYKNAIANTLLAHPELDGIFMAGAGQNLTAVAEAMHAGGKDKFALGVFDYSDAMGDAFKKGDLTIINGGHMITATFSALMAINTYFGTPLSEEKMHVTIPYLTLSSYEDYEAYLKYASEGDAYTPDEMKQFLKINNPELTLESFQEMVSNWSVADIQKRLGE